MPPEDVLESVTAAESGAAIFLLVVSGGLGWAVARCFPPKARPGPLERPLWGGAEVLVAVGILFLSQVVFGRLVSGLQDSLAPGHLVAMQILTACAGCVIIVLWVGFSLGQPLSTFGFRPTSWRNVAVVLVLSIPVRFFIGSVAHLWRTLLVQGFGVELEAQEAVRVIAEEIHEGRHVSVALLIVGGMVLAPLWEEFFFRGFLFAWLERLVGFWAGALSSGLLFALVHYSLDVFVPLWILGVLLAWLYARSRSLLVPILFHLVFNGTTLVVLLLNGGVV